MFGVLQHQEASDDMPARCRRYDSCVQSLPRSELALTCGSWGNSAGALSLLSLSATFVKATVLRDQVCSGCHPCHADGLDVRGAPKTPPRPGSLEGGTREISGLEAHGIDSFPKTADASEKVAKPTIMTEATALVRTGMADLVASKT